MTNSRLDGLRSRLASTQTTHCRAVLFTNTVRQHGCSIYTHRVHGRCWWAVDTALFWASVEEHAIACLSRFVCVTTPIKQGVILTGRNRTGPPWSVGRPTAHAPGDGRPDGWQRYRRRRRQTSTDDRWRRQTPATVTSLPPTLCVGGPAMTETECIRW